MISWYNGHQAVRVFDRVAASGIRALNRSSATSLISTLLIVPVPTLTRCITRRRWWIGGRVKVGDCMTNVRGTLNVIRACQLQGVRRLIYTSSPTWCLTATRS
ncbi:MAG: hypothetical protein U0559_09320 [Anaerolineae bacterium]